jgi:alkylation response protein AidB-like acyl-CoA dehydrogenase
MTQGLSDAGLLVTGRDGSSAESGPWARQWLWSKAASIAGGTSQVQRDIIAGRILGLPR